MRTFRQTKTIRRRTAVAISAGALAAAGLIALGTAPASAGPVNLGYTTPGTYTWTVPQGIDSVSLFVTGAQGAGGTTYPGGKGAGVSAIFRVNAGQVLTLQVGNSGGGVGGGGAPGIGQKSGYAGGGASRVSRSGELLIVAGGGGGAAFDAAGGASGTPGGSSAGATNGRAGGPGTGSAAGSGGAGGTVDNVSWCYYAGAAGHPGSGGTGGAGGSASVGGQTLKSGGGGGGGGGYYGGGGGGGSSACWTDPQHFADPRGGGGGGGSSYLSPVRLAGSVTEGARANDGSIVISYQDPEGPKAAPVVSPAPNAAGWNNTDVYVIWNWTDPTGSGIDPARCAATTTLGMSGTDTVSSTCADLSGNVSKAQMPFSVKIDKVQPTAAPVFDPEGVTWNWSDTGSGIDPSRCPATSPEAEETTATCFDVAGNSVTITLPRHG